MTYANTSDTGNRRRQLISLRRRATLGLFVSQLLAEPVAFHSFLQSVGPRHAIGPQNRATSIHDKQALTRSTVAGTSYGSTSRTPARMCGDPIAAAEGGRPSTWSNVGGQDVVQIAESLYAAERPFVWNGIDVGGRMAIIKLSDGSLWVHSPVDLDERLREALNKIGPVKHIVSPNYEHVKYAQQWMEAYPSARSYACPGLPEREPDVAFSRSVGDQPGDNTPPEWGGEIQACFIDCENNPFTGKPFFNEVVFFHRPTKALISSDLFWSYPREVPLGTRVWKWGMDKVYLPFYKRFMVTDKGQFEGKVKEIIDWGIDIIVPCHGKVIRTGATEVLREQLGRQ